MQFRDRGNKKGRCIGVSPFLLLSDYVKPLISSSLSNPVVVGVSKLLFQCGSRDAINRVSTTTFGKLLIFNVLYVATPVETWRAALVSQKIINILAQIAYSKAVMF